MASLADAATSFVPHLYVVTDRRATGGRHVADVVRAALSALPPPHERAGVNVAVQLREKDLGGRELVALARQLRAITHDAGVALYVNERVDVARVVDADGVHLGWTSLAPQDARAIAPDLARAVSTHARDEVLALGRQGAASFVVYGPIFDTPSKRGFLAPRGLDALAEAAATGLPVVAIGGIDAASAAACLERGAHGVACIRPVMAAAEPDAALAALFDAVRRARRA